MDLFTNKNGKFELTSHFSQKENNNPSSLKELYTNLYSTVKEILNTIFKETVKREIYEFPNRINFACPYCLDSSKDIYKKRGNIFITKNNVNYHCYNCNKHTTINNFLKDFDKRLDSSDFLLVTELEDNFAKNGPVYNTLDFDIFLSDELINKYAIDRHTLFKKLNLQEIKYSTIQNYLRKRQQFNFVNFGWNAKFKKLFVFNLSKDNKKVLGLQIRSFGKSKNKYVTYKLNGIYERILKKETPDTEEFNYLNELSTIFGINKIDINKPINVFEGPLDSFLIKNSVATCSVNKKFPFDIRVRYIYDYDKAGRKKALVEFQNGEIVFLWKKFFNDYKTSLNLNNKIDMNDIVIEVKENKKNLPNLNLYFSRNKYDAYWI